MTTIKTYSNFKKGELIFSTKSPSKKLMPQVKMAEVRNMMKKVLLVFLNRVPTQSLPQGWSLRLEEKG
jgi:hypothetical protein